MATTIMEEDTSMIITDEHRTTQHQTDRFNQSQDTLIKTTRESIRTVPHEEDHETLSNDTDYGLQYAEAIIGRDKCRFEDTIEPEDEGVSAHA